MKITCSS